MSEVAPSVNPYLSLVISENHHRFGENTNPPAPICVEASSSILLAVGVANLV